MHNKALLSLLEQVQSGVLLPDKALEAIDEARLLELGCARLDTQREWRTGFPEVVYAESKSTDDLLQIVEAFLEKQGKVLITRLKQEQSSVLQQNFPCLICHTNCGVAFYKAEDNSRKLGKVAVLSAGTSDSKVAEEAFVCGEYFDIEMFQINDIGIAGLHRLIDCLPQIQLQDLLIVVAGMEGALPGVVAGLCPVPVIAVPSSVGYGVSLGGITALFSMLVSCSPGLTVVNIDNGFGAALAAARILRHLKDINGTQPRG